MYSVFICTDDFVSAFRRENRYAVSLLNNNQETLPLFIGLDKRYVTVNIIIYLLVIGSIYLYFSCLCFVVHAF